MAEALAGGAATGERGLGKGPSESHPRSPRWRGWDEAAYLRLRCHRDRLLEVVVAPLARAGVSPHILSLLGVASAASTWWSFGVAPRWALAALAAALACDAADGALARRRGTASAAGKLFDHLCDAATLVALLAAASRGGVASPARATLAAVLCPSLVLLAILFHSAHGPRPWRLNPRGGFFAHLPKLFIFAAVALHLGGGPDWIDPALLVANGVAAGVGAVLSAALAHRRQVVRTIRRTPG